VLFVLCVCFVYCVHRACLCCVVRVCSFVHVCVHLDDRFLVICAVCAVCVVCVCMFCVLCASCVSVLCCARVQLCACVCVCASG